MNAATLHSNTSADRIYPVIITLYSYLSSFSRIANYLFNNNKAIEYFRHFYLKQFS